MRLHSIALKNYRLFSHLECTFHPELTVIVATNGGGKTTILDAIRVAFGTYLAKFPKARGEPIRPSDVRQTKSDEEVFRMAKIFPAQVHATGTLDDNEKTVSWSRSANTAKSGTTMKEARVLAGYAIKLQHAATDLQDKTNWPLLAYYGTGRLWSQKKLTSGKIYASSFNSRAAGYTDCMEPASSYKLFVDWFGYAYRSITQSKILYMEANPDASARETIAHQSAYTPLVDAVREAVNIVLEPCGWKQLWYSETLQDVIVVHDELGRLAVSQLSDGIRNSIALVADIAFRAVQLNSHLGAVAVKETEGIVLIDEVDMHLHPSWQQVVLENLRTAFPKIQFIVTTHSPQVLTTVKSENIRELGRDANGVWRARSPIQEIKGAESAVALNDIMKVNPIPPVDEAQWLADYIAKIEIGTHEDEDGLALRTKLIALYGPTHPTILDADRLIRFQSFKVRNSVPGQR